MKKSIERETVEYYTQQLKLEIEAKANMANEFNALVAFNWSISEMREYLAERMDVPESILDSFMLVAIATDYDTFGETHPYQYYDAPNADDVWRIVLRRAH